MYDGYKVYGPYKRSEDGRKIVRLYKSQSDSKVMLYARYILELSIGRYLTENENVHHKDENYFNDREDNLEVVAYGKHQSNHQQIYESKVFICAGCKKEFTLTAIQVRQRCSNVRRKGVLKGPYCSKKCNGKVNH